MKAWLFLFWSNQLNLKKMSTILEKIKSVKLCLMAHPDNEQDSEFSDRISDLEEIENELLKDTIEFAEWLREECYDIGSHWLYQKEDEIYTSLEIFEVFKRDVPQNIT